MKSCDKSKTVTQFLDEEYLGYAKYVVDSRAIPSAVDGFKPSQRKIAHAANVIWKTGREKPMKVFQLGGSAASISRFHHGSLDGTIIGMTQEFKNSMPIFDGIGQFGSLRSPDPGAPRYIGVVANDNFRLLYKDSDLCEPQFEEGDEIEPKFFLPIIPTVLLNGGSGIAVGFATNILNRNPIELIDACLDVLAGRPVGELAPWIRGFEGKFKKSNDSERSWVIEGVLDVKNATTVEVTELPPSMTYEKYEQHLESLIERGIISSYDDASAERPSYTIKFPRATLSSLVEKDRLVGTLALREREGENYTVLDDQQRVKVFDGPEEIVRWFVGLRLKYYEVRKAKELVAIEANIATTRNRLRFVKEVIAETIMIGGRPRLEIESELSSKKFDRRDGEYDYLLGMSIFSLTKEKILELKAQLDNLEKRAAEISSVTPEKMYELDLKELRKLVGKSKRK